jgi:hypothetical protein
MTTKASKSGKFEDTMHSEYNMRGGVRGTYASRSKADMQADNEVFSKVGFDPSLRDAFNRICAIIESTNGCNARLYKPPHMKQMRAAHVAPGDGGRKIAKQVFLMVNPRIHEMVLLRRRFRKKKPRNEWLIKVDADFSQWAGLEVALKEWSHDVKVPIKPKTVLEWGDGHALPGGLPETNRTKF